MRKHFLVVFMLFLSVFTLACNSDNDYTWGKWKDNGDGTHTRICRENFELIETSEHNFGDAEVIKPVSDIHNGIVRYMCTDCHYSFEEIIPPTGNHNFTLEIADEEHVYKNVSSATVVYYKTCEDCGAFGNEDYLFEKTNLPENYIEVEYLNFSGFQCIDTGVLFDSVDCLPIKIETTVAPKDSSGNKNLCIAGCGDAKWIGPVSLNLYNNSMEFGTNGWNRKGNYTAGVKTSFEANISANSQTFSKDGEVFISDKKSFVTSKNSLWIGNFNIGVPLVGIYYKGDLYSFKISCKGELVRDFIPVYNLDLKLYGLYDLVTEKFFDNSNKLTHGDIVEESTLPEEYMEVEFIESHGAQLVYTGVKEHATWEMDLQFEVNGRRQLMGYGGSGAEYWGVQTDGTYGLWPEKSQIKAGNRDIIVHDYEGDQRFLYVNGQKVISVGHTEISADYKLFDLSKDGNFGCSVKMYSCKATINGELIRNFIPCVEISTMRAGLYDTITNKFYTDNNNPCFGGGGYAGHDFNQGQVVQEATYCQDGKVVYKCNVCGKEIEKVISKFAYKVELITDENTEKIKVFKDINPENYEITNIAFSRNKNTYNYSKVDGIVMCEIVVKDGFVIDEIKTNSINAKVEKIEKNKYIISGIDKDLTISITTKVKVKFINYKFKV